MQNLRKQGDLSVKSFYKYLSTGEENDNAIFLVKQIWKLKAPLRVAFFA